MRKHKAKALSSCLNLVSSALFLAIFLVSLCFPVYGRFVDNDLELSGVIDSNASVDCNLSTVFSGSCQGFLENKWNNVFPGRKFLLKIRNQILYSFLNTSPNSNVVIGKQKYLFEPDYIEYEYKACRSKQNDNIEAVVDELKNFHDRVALSDKELYVFITPSKTRFLKDKIPAQYFLNDKPEDMCTYDFFVDQLKKSGIDFFDGVAYVKERYNQDDNDVPLFTKTGIHWSQPYGENAAAEFLKYINSNSSYNFSTISVAATKSAEPYAHDVDLYNSLNLLEPANDDWYRTTITIKTDNAITEKPNVFMRGGSFMGQSLAMLVNQKIFDKVVYFENNYYYLDELQSPIFISAFRSYDELDLPRFLCQSDIIILEVNESKIDVMSWGFIDYVLDHIDIVNSCLQE